MYKPADKEYFTQKTFLAIEVWDWIVLIAYSSLFGQKQDKIYPTSCI